MAKQRLDRWMVERGLGGDAREGAGADHGRRGSGERPESDQGRADRGLPPPTFEVTARLRYVSRGGLKLEGALKHFAYRRDRPRVRRFRRLPPAASPIACCRPGAARVHAIDVGTGQLDWRLRNDPRVVVHEGVNARYLNADDLGRTGRPGGLRRQFHFGDADSARHGREC